LELILSNLIDNALTYVSKDTSPKIEISSLQEGQYVVISIKDNGIGIPHKFHEKIFDLFQRLHSEEEYPSTGMGLAIAKRAVELLGEEIRVESEVGVGSTFL